MITPKWPRVLCKLAHFSSTHEYRTRDHGIEHSVYTPPILVIALLCVDAPRGLFRVPFLPPSTSTERRNFHPTALFRTREIIFAHILVSSRVP